MAIAIHKIRLVQPNKTHQATEGHLSTVHKYVKAELGQTQTCHWQHRLYTKSCLYHTQRNICTCNSLQGCLLCASTLKSIASTLKSIACHQLCMHRHSSEYEGANTARTISQASSNKDAMLVHIDQMMISCCSLIL